MMLIIEPYFVSFILFVFLAAANAPLPRCSGWLQPHFLPPLRLCAPAPQSAPVYHRQSSHCRRLRRCSRSALGSKPLHFIASHRRLRQFESSLAILSTVRTGDDKPPTTMSRCRMMGRCCSSIGVFGIGGKCWEGVR